MWWYIVFLVLLSWSFGASTAQSFPVATTKILNYANSNDSARLFYTALSQITVFEDYDPADYPTEKALNIAMLAAVPSNCTCPELREIHSVTTPYGQLRFERAEKMTADLVDHGLAGYLAPLPGYCGSDGVEVIEFWSPILKQFRYDTSNNIYSYYTDFKNQFRPVRVLGYASYTTPQVWLSGNPPFIKQGATSPFYRAISVRFDMVRVLTKNGKNSYAVTPSLVKKMVTEDGWALTDQVVLGPMSAQNELEKIRTRGGADFLQRCRDTYDPVTGLYRPINLDRMPIGNKTIVGDCGYFLKSNSVFANVNQAFSWTNDYGSGPLVTYANYDFNTGNNSVGYASQYLFQMLKL